MNGNDQYLESVERQWGNFTDDELDETEDKILAGLDKLLESQRRLTRLAEDQQELAEELRDTMREEGIGGY